MHVKYGPVPNGILRMVLWPLCAQDCEDCEIVCCPSVILGFRRVVANTPFVVNMAPDAHFC